MLSSAGADKLTAHAAACSCPDFALTCVNTAASLTTAFSVTGPRRGVYASPSAYSSATCLHDSADAQWSAQSKLHAVDQQETGALYHRYAMGDGGRISMCSIYSTAEGVIIDQLASTRSHSHLLRMLVMMEVPGKRSPQASIRLDALTSSSCMHGVS